jgi:ribose 5-phosphate isomerase B
VAVAEGRAERAILICGTGIGMSIVANKIRGVRCALCRDANDAQMARRHNNANALALRGRGADPAESRRIIEVFLTEPYEGGRHQRRLDQIAALEVAPGGACGSR